MKARGACERCGKTERLHAHHKDRDKGNNTLANGECLCVWCHDEEHDNPALIVLDATAHQAHLGVKHSAETKRRISEAGRKRYEDPAERERSGGRVEVRDTSATGT